MRSFSQELHVLCNRSVKVYDHGDSRDVLLICHVISHDHMFKRFKASIYGWESLTVNLHLVTFGGF